MPYNTILIWYETSKIAPELSKDRSLVARKSPRGFIPANEAATQISITIHVHVPDAENPPEIPIQGSLLIIVSRSLCTGVAWLYLEDFGRQCLNINRHYAAHG